MDEAVEELRSSISFIMDLCDDMICYHDCTDVSIVCDVMKEMEAGLEKQVAQNDPEKGRAWISDMRQRLNEVNLALNRLMGDTADQYRQILGDRKEWFEAASEEEQESEPEALYAKELYDNLKDAKEAVTKLNADLMTLSGKMEHILLASRPKPDIDVHSDPTLDPAPSSLSP